MSILNELADATVRRVPVLFAWSCRRAQELEFVSPPVVAMLQAIDCKQLTTRLYITGACARRCAPSSSWWRGGLAFSRARCTIPAAGCVLHCFQPFPPPNLHP
jgi:hypothetical protein